MSDPPTGILATEERRLPAPGGWVWSVRLGTGRARPLVIVHGGPGSTHDYLRPLAEALASGRPVILYDQLGAGRSDPLPDPTDPRLERFTDELAAVLSGWGLADPHLLGHSWGAIPVVDLLRGRPAGRGAVVLASPSLDIPRWNADAARHIAGLEPADRAALSAPPGTPAHATAARVYARRHVCRLSPWPKALRLSLAGSNPDVYDRLWGEGEHRCTGRLATLDWSPRLASLERRVLVTCGRHDTATPDTCARLAGRPARGQLAVFDNSSHVPHLEEPTAYARVVGAFLAGRPVRP